jgi:hypothetical protein
VNATTISTIVMKQGEQAAVGLQPHEHAPQLAEVGALLLQPPAQQAVLDAVDLQRGLAHDAHQHVALVVQQVVQQIDRRAEAHPLLHGLAQAIDAAQRMRPRAHRDALADAAIRLSCASSIRVERDPWRSASKNSGFSGRFACIHACADASVRSK